MQNISFAFQCGRTYGVLIRQAFNTGYKNDSRSCAGLVYIDHFIWCIYKQAHAEGGQ